MWERYLTPHTLEAALELLAEHHGHACIIAGGTDLILELEREQRPGITTLIDISRVPGLDEVRLDHEGWIHLGPLVTHNHCAGSAVLVEHAFALARACWDVGSPQIRNRGTIAGNLITASPANDSIPPLMALDAQLTLRSPREERVVPLREFYAGVRKTVMSDDEVLVDVAFRAPSLQSRSMFVKLGLRLAQAISIVNAAVVVELDGDRVQQASITLGSVAPTVIHAPDAEQYLIGKRLTAEVVIHAGELAAEASQPIDDLRASAAYRRDMVRVCTMRALRAIASGHEHAGYPSSPIMLWGKDGMRVRPTLSASHLHEAGTPIETTINGTEYLFKSGHEKTLLRLLREDAGLIGTKEGCAEGECGACTVFLDGVAVMACLVPAPRAHKAQIITVEGLKQNGKLHPVQQAFIDEGAVQCGYCTPGFLMSAAKLLEERSTPSREDIIHAITGNLCRCTGYYKIISAIERAAQSLGTGAG